MSDTQMQRIFTSLKATLKFEVAANTSKKKRNIIEWRSLLFRSASEDSRGVFEMEDNIQRNQLGATITVGKPTTFKEITKVQKEKKTDNRTWRRRVSRERATSRDPSQRNTCLVEAISFSKRNDSPSMKNNRVQWFSALRGEPQEEQTKLTGSWVLW